MTYQETIWKNKYVWVTGIVARSGKAHRYVARYVGRGGMVVRSAKNGMLIVRFSTHERAIPAGCLSIYGQLKWAQ